MRPDGTERSVAGSSHPGQEAEETFELAIFPHWLSESITDSFA